jgi:hypothetical protein
MMMVQPIGGPVLDPAAIIAKIAEGTFETSASPL